MKSFGFDGDTSLQEQIQMKALCFEKLQNKFISLKKKNKCLKQVINMIQSQNQATLQQLHQALAQQSKENTILKQQLSDQKNMIKQTKAELQEVKRREREEVTSYDETLRKLQAEHEEHTKIMNIQYTQQINDLSKQNEELSNTVHAQNTAILQDKLTQLKTAY